MRVYLLCGFLLCQLLNGVHLAGQPRLVVKKKSSYQAGDRVDPGSFVLDRNLQRIPLGELIHPDSRLVVLILFGGGFRQQPDRPQFRGTLWCEDSFDDLGVQRAIYRAFKGRGVQFVPVAIPPVYGPESFGWGKDDFLGFPDDDPNYKEAAKSFVAATEAERETGLLPFDQIFYDPKHRLAQNKGEREPNGEVFEWQGKLKWHQDARKYGTPTIWFLDSEGHVLTDPLFGNDYDSEPPQIQYGYRDIADLLERLLGSSTPPP